MKVTISFDGNNIVGYEDEKPLRNKGMSLLEFPNEYVVIDLETTGLNSKFDEIIEVSGLKVVDDKVVDKFTSLVKPRSRIPSYIEELTGITNNTVQNAQRIEHVLPDFINFIDRSILVAYNAHFDINFIYDNYLEIFNTEFRNDFVDVLRVSRRIYPDLHNHRLTTLARHLNIEYINGHRATEDCIVCNAVFLSCKKVVVENGIDLNSCKTNRKSHQKISARNILPNTMEYDSEHPLFNKVCVFTGTLNRFDRRDAMQIVVNLGGSCRDNITKDTDFLVMGAQDYSKFSDGKKSTKTKKAEQLILSGHDIGIITEDVFYEMIADYAQSC